MSPVLEIWACDMCNPDGCDGPSENEDTGRDNGWHDLRRTQVRGAVFPAVPDTNIKELRIAPFPHHDRLVICPPCAAEHGERLRAEGWVA